MPDFLLELLSEEIPARMQPAAAAQLARALTEALAGAGVVTGAVDTHTTPRRLAAIVRGLPERTADTSEERRGPRADAPAQALAGFLKSTGLAREQLVERDDAKGRFFYAVIARPGRPAAELLAALMPQLIRSFDWPKSMRWGEASRRRDSLRWVRPLTGIVALLGDAVVPFEIDGLASGRTTQGHRFLSRGAVEIADAASYSEALRAAHVIIDPAERGRIIADRARALVVTAGLRLIEDAGLVAENAGLTEWPVPLLGRFDPAFLEVPREIIQLTMRTNQKYFACTDDSGNLAPAFVCVANIEAADGGRAIVAGNEKVLTARLADAKFFWDADLKAVREGGLESFTPKLANIVFHEKLGTLADKVDRVAKLARWLVESGAVAMRQSTAPNHTAEVNGSTRSSSVIPEQAGTHGRDTPDSDAVPMGPGVRRDDSIEQLADLAEQAARLCKADLTTATVGEFPEVQGIAGRYLALAQGLDPQIADAIRDHYKPIGQTDDVPTAPVSVAVALADKFDTIASFFTIKQDPTGSRDPFALRRAALGFIALLFKGRVKLRTRAIGEAWAEANGLDYLSVAAALDRLTVFFIERLEVQQREAGVSHDLIEAVVSTGSMPHERLDLIVERGKSLQAFLLTPDGTNLLAGYKRAANILAIEEKKSGTDFDGDVDPARLVEPAEQQLAAALDRVAPDATAAVAREDFGGAMAALAQLRPAVDAFFDAVIVNAPDAALRQNRLNLLNRLRRAVHNVADFSKIEGAAQR